MSTIDLRELLERALDLEEKAAAEGAGPVDDDFYASEPTVEELKARLAELEDTVFALSHSDLGGGEWKDGVPPQVDVIDVPDGLLDDDEGDEGMDFEEVDDESSAEVIDPVLLAVQGKAAGWAACSQCGSTDADEYADGTARCAECGFPLQGSGTATKDDGGGLEVKDGVTDEPVFDDDEDPAPEVKSAETLSEMELLLARRASLGA